MSVTAPQLSNDIYYPMLVSDETEPVEAKFQMWLKFRQLPEEKRNILVSEEVAWKMKELQDTFHLQEPGVAGVSLVVRKVFFGELDFPGAEARIGSLLTATGSGDPNQASAIVGFIQKDILTLKPAKDVATEDVAAGTPVLKTVRLPLLKAMGEYRHLSEQLLTGEKIKLKSSMEPQRPTLSNWLKSYREELGIGFHEPVLRGNFLFQSQNGKRLSNNDRARLNLVLKSIEEDFPLEIDTEHQAILFPRADDSSMELAQVKSRPMDRMIRPRGLPTANVPVGLPTPPATEKPSAFQAFKPLFAKAAAPEKNVSGETLHFSTGHVLPAEREAESSIQADSNEALRQMQHPTQAIRREAKEPLARSPYSIRPLRSRNSNTEAD